VSDLLEVRDLAVEFRTQVGVIRAVDGMSFRVRAGSTVALVGESGSGKSVMAQAIMGILPRTARIVAGEMLFSDPAGETPPPAGAAADTPAAPVNLATLDPGGPAYMALRGNRMSMIFQEPMTSLSPLHTIGDQVSETLYLHKRLDKGAGRGVAIAMLGMVGFPDPKAAFGAYPFELSGGLRQRAMIAMALVCRPSLLIADEPSTALDVTIQAQILKLIQDLQKELGMAVLIITHDLGVVANVAEEVVVVYHGRVMESGALDDIFDHPAHPYLKALLRAVPHFDMKPGERLVPVREIKHATGHMLTRKRAADVGSAGDSAPLLEVRRVSKAFGYRRSFRFFGPRGGAPIKAVDDVSFHVRRGECLGLVGESGCGKTTLSKIVMRAIDADEGAVLFSDGGKQVNLLSLRDQQLVPYRRRIQYVFQDPFSSLNPRMTVFNILGEPLAIHGIGDESYRRELVSELMALVGLDPRTLNRYPHSFSGGQRQRIGIARALALQPDLLLCDEPVSSLDVSVQAQILNLLKDLQQELGLTYLFISHNLAVVDYMADRIAVMCGGRIVELAPRERLFRDPVHPYTRQLLAAVPYPDPRRRLDFSALLEERLADPAAWPPPFGDRGKGEPSLIDLGGGHFVRAHPSPEFGSAPS
jgi:peptide/nickel transport system ATP-binding protein